MKQESIIVIGAGIAGLGAAYALREAGKRCIVLEAEDFYGGLCANFTIGHGFRFDRFVHFSFTNEPQVKEIFYKSTDGEYFSHIPNPYNIYNRIWIKHPAQNNLYPLSEIEKYEIINDFKQRPQIDDSTTFRNYEEWLKAQYGNAFAERFPMVYTSKYWMCEARDLETKWVGNRLYQPSIDEVVAGATSPDTPVTYYAKEMRYPKKGGFKHFLEELTKDADIRYNNQVIEINTEEKLITTKDNKKYYYSRVISSMPLPELIKILIPAPPKEIRESAKNLKCTSGYLISVALKNNNIPQFLWWYIYDKDILPARVYSPSLKSEDNAPIGCSSLQMEVYCHKDDFTREELISNSIYPLIEMGLIKEEDILEVDIRFEPWANIVFDHKIYEERTKVLDYVRSVGIEPIGRFGLWDYLWSDQALLSGLSIKNN